MAGDLSHKGEWYPTKLIFLDKIEQVPPEHLKTHNKMLAKLAVMIEPVIHLQAVVMIFGDFICWVVALDFLDPIWVVEVFRDKFVHLFL